MELSRQTVEQIANLARLELSEADIVLYQQQLSSILAYAERLNDLDLDGVPETTHAVPTANIWRADQVSKTLTHEQALRNAAKTADNQFVIQAVLDEE